MEFHVPPLFVILVAAVAAPLLGEITRKLGIAVVVLEILLGVAIGPQGLGWGKVEGSVPYISLLGMVFLFFLAGLEIDLQAIAGPPLRRAIIGWMLGYALAIVAALLMNVAGLVQAWHIVAIALATTALGVLVPILRDSKLLDTSFGRYVMAAGVVGELGPILAMSIVLARKHTVAGQTLFTAIFIAVVIAVGYAMVNVKIPGFLKIVGRTMTQSSQLPVRLCVLLLATMTVLAELFGVDFALGALAAGMIVGLATLGTQKEILHQKLDAIAFGFFVPVFFITSGMKLDVHAIFGSAGGLALMAAFFVALLLVRIPVVLLLREKMSVREASAVCLYSATTLSLVVALTQIGVENGLMTPAEAAPLIGAGVLTVLLFPLIAPAVAGQKRARRSVRFDDRDGF